jgi:tRNA-binding EMAP/Myf-like protein
MKKIILGILVLFVSLNTSYAASEQWINSTGSGATYEEAKDNALRNALELAFGTFISSNTVIRNDILQKDEIVGISTGNIKKFSVISKTVIDGKYLVALNVLVSPEKLATFVRSQGMVVEYQGESFGSNIKIQVMNENSEKQAIQTLSNYAKLVYSRCFSYELKVQDPNQYMSDSWEIKMELSIRANKNFDDLYNHIIKTLGSISLNSGDIETRKKMGNYPYVLVMNKLVSLHEQLGQLSEKQKRELEKNNKKIEALEKKYEELYLNYYAFRQRDAVKKEIEELRKINDKIIPSNTSELNPTTQSNQFMLRTNEARITLWNLFGVDMENALGSVRISMDAGEYSRDIEFSNFKLLKDGGADYIIVNPESRSENELTNILNSDKFTYISFEANKYGGIFAKFSYALFIQGQNSVNIISKIKGFKVIKP